MDPAMSTLGFGPVDDVVRLLMMVHDATGLPWWGAIALTTVAVRASLLPLVIVQQKTMGRLALAKPEFDRVQAVMKERPPVTDKERAEYAVQMQEVTTKHQIKMSRTFLPMLVQFPVFISFFWGIQECTSIFPSFHEGGLFWFKDLTVPDPTYVLPVLTSGLFLATIEMGGEMQTEQSKKMKNIMRAMAVAMVPLTAGMSAGIFTYFITSNTFSIFQVGAMKIPAVRSALGLLPLPGTPDLILKTGFIPVNITKPVTDITSSQPKPGMSAAAAAAESTTTSISVPAPTTTSPLSNSSSGRNVTSEGESENRERRKLRKNRR